MIALDEDRALVRADKADIAASNDEDWGPLHGVPLRIKDTFCTEGLITVGGVPDYSEYVPTKSALAVQRYTDAGAIIFGKTSVSDFEGAMEVLVGAAPEDVSAWRIELPKSSFSEITQLRVAV